MEIAFIIFGLIVGSFLTVCIYRLPFGRGWDEIEDDTEDGSTESKGEEDFVKKKEEENNITIGSPPRSFCPHCHKQLLWWHNIPFFSWLLLKGKCWYCKTPISIRYPFVEVLTALASYLSFTTYGITPIGFVVFAFCSALIVISFIDYDYYIIPNVISLPGTVIGVALAGVNQFTHIFPEPMAANLLESALGILAGGGFLYAVAEGYFRLRKKEGLGMGDVKLLAMTGAFFGWQASFYTIFMGSLFGSVIGLSLIVLLRKKMSHELPFGPYLAMGTVLYLFGVSGWLPIFKM